MDNNPTIKSLTIPRGSTLYISHRWSKKMMIIFIVTGLLEILFFYYNPFIKRISSENITNTITIVNSNNIITEKNDYKALLKTTQCTIPYHNYPLIQYAIMIDAGSMGTRIHVYRFNYCNASPILEYETFKEVKPGLSAYPEHPKKAADSLDSLLQFAIKEIPEELHECTPVSVKATAGLRLLGKEESDAILKAVEDKLKNEYPFILPNEDGVILMGGKEEGVYAWFTVNYILGRIGEEEKLDTVAMMDLGGGSTQIVFEPLTSERRQYPFPTSCEENYRVDFRYGHFNYSLYQHSYLGYGLMEARKSIMSRIINMENEYTLNNNNSSTNNNPYNNSDRGNNHNHDNNNNNNNNNSINHDPSIIIHHCFPEAFNEQIQVEGQKTPIQIQGTKRMSFDRCLASVKHALFNKTAVCMTAPCSFDGVYQPPIKGDFHHPDLYAFSFFYDRTTVFDIGLNPEIEEIAELARTVCRHKHEYESITAEDPYFCLDLTYLYTLLSFGYAIHPGEKILLAKKIDEVEMGWCLGATIQMLDQLVQKGIIQSCHRLSSKKRNFHT